jgi:8-oxo-dGTP diphosphatase
MISRIIMRFRSIDWSTWVPKETATLLFVVREGQILLIHKKRGLGAGKINGPGGRLEPGESAESAAVREVEEELCITPTGVRRSGELRFQFTDGHSIHCFVFRANDFLGSPQTTDEAIPQWFPVGEIPYHRMWADDRIWLPLMLESIPFSGRFLLEGDRMLGYEIDRDPDQVEGGRQTPSIRGSRGYENETKM